MRTVKLLRRDRPIPNPDRDMSGSRGMQVYPYDYPGYVEYCAIYRTDPMSRKDWEKQVANLTRGEAWTKNLIMSVAPCLLIE
jgi:hypothetical protein